MFRLSREIRFSIDPKGSAGATPEGRNGHAGKPPLTRLGQSFASLSVTLTGEPEAATGYLLNIKLIDDVVRSRGVDLVTDAVRNPGPEAAQVLVECFGRINDAFSPHRLHAIELRLSPFTSLATTNDLLQRPKPMVLLHHTFEFAASHRLHNPAFSDARNREVFGKCNNPHGHGHNYVLRVTLRGEPGTTGMLADLPELERLVDEAVIQPFDHKHLNLEVAEFARLNPSVENIAMVIFQKLAGPLTRDGVALDSVTVWETPRTWCEYRE